MMSVEDFDLRLKHIEEQYGARRESADAYRDQELSRLFNECGWTQERIARRVGKSQRWVSYRLTFGAFLRFRTSGSETDAPAVSTLTERGFRSLWAKTEGDDRSRFGQVLGLLRDESLPAGYRNLVAKPGYAAALRELLADGKWHGFDDLAAGLQERFPDVGRGKVTNNLQNLEARPGSGKKLESRRKGGGWQYRIVTVADDGDGLGAVTTLHELVKPLIEEIKFWGSRHRAELSPQEILRIGVRLERLFDAALKGRHAGSV